MQKLVFHPAWNRTISELDRKKIEDIFQETHHSIINDYKIIPLWQAVNHHGDFLLTTLIHNKTDHNLAFHNVQVEYAIHDETVTSNIFSIPDLLVEPGTSMPWTFIFPKDKWNPFDLNKMGEVVI